MKKYLLLTVLSVLGLIGNKIFVTSAERYLGILNSSLASKVKNTNNFNWTNLIDGTVKAAVKSHQPVGASARDKLNLEESQELYDRRCAYCHGEEGITERPNTPSLAEPEFQRSRTDQQLFTAISEGIAPRMPSYSDSLSEAEIRGLVAFIRSFGKNSSVQKTAQNALSRNHAKKSARTRNFK